MTALISVTGGIVRAIDIRYTQQSKAFASGTIASTERYKDKDGNFKDGESLYLPFVVWGDMAENIAQANLEQGQQVTLTGNLYTRKYEDKTGAQRSSTELKVKDFAVSLKRATVQVTKTSGQGAGPGGSQGTFQAPAAPAYPPAATGGQGDVWGAPGATYPAEETLPF